MIVVAIQGISDNGTKFFLARLARMVPSISCYGCFDFDLRGFQILKTLKYSSISSTWQIPPLPSLHDILYPCAIHYKADELTLNDASTKDIDSDKLENFKERPWLEAEPMLKESLETMGKLGKVSMNSLFHLSPDFFECKLKD